ncbi:MAG: type IX secretion system ring protein PorN/GldN [Breznakibacter sp.]
MKKLYLFFVLSVFFVPFTVTGQENVLDGLFEKGHVANRKPIPYVHVREADVLWSKTVWRVIDLREKMNLSLYYPTTSFDGRFSLISLLMQGVQFGQLTAYSAKTDDEFKVRLKMDDVLQELGASSDTQSVRNATTGLYEQKIVTGDVRTDQVKQFLVKEVWFFDRNYSRMDVRIIGICPIREYVREEGGDGEVIRKPLFWVYFPEARPLLASHEVFNPKNDAVRYTFDDVFNKRYFGSYIYRESNVFNNRQIDQYTAGMEAMLEAERIKNDLYNKEHDMWEF